jgi:hypothetical protein
MTQKPTLLTITLLACLSLAQGQAIPNGLLFQNELEQESRDLSWLARDVAGDSLSDSHSSRTDGRTRRTHPIDNIYRQNSHIRRTMEDLENEMPYYQTGVRGDPEFRVSYKNHPFDRLRVEREAAAGGDGE